MILVIAIWVTKRSSEKDLVTPKTLFSLLIIPLTGALLLTLWITTTSDLESSGRANNEVDKSILYITFFGVVMSNAAMLMAFTHAGPKDYSTRYTVESGLTLSAIVAAILQVNQIYHNYWKTIFTFR